MLLYFRSRRKQLNIKENKIGSPAQVSACSGCAVGCVFAQNGAATDALGASYTREDAAVVPVGDVPVAALNRVVGVLFGIPLLGMLGLVSILQSSGAADQPVLSLFIFGGVGLVWLRLLVPYGDRLLNVLQSQPLPTSNGRI